MTVSFFTIHNPVVAAITAAALPDKSPSTRVIASVISASSAQLQKVLLPPTAIETFKELEEQGRFRRLSIKTHARCIEVAEAILSITLHTLTLFGGTLITSTCFSTDRFTFEESVQTAVATTIVTAITDKIYPSSALESLVIS